MALIYKKTDKGLTEIETRAQRLTPRLRSLLILVDGRRDVAAIRALVQQPTEDALQALELQGLVAVVGDSTTVPVAEKSAARTAPAPVSNQVPATPTVVPMRADNFNALRSQAVRALLDAVGPAGDMLAMRLEKARSAPELQPLLVQAARLVAELGGRAAGERFTVRFLTGT